LTPHPLFPFIISQAFYRLSQRIRLNEYADEQLSPLGRIESPCKKRAENMKKTLKKAKFETL